MSKDEFEKYLGGRYKKQVDWYDKKSIRNHKMYQIFQWISISFSAITPVLILINNDVAKWIAVSVAVVVAISTSAIKTFKYQENWINYRTTCETLRKEKYLYEANIQGYEIVDDPEALFVERVESLISRENTLWVVTHEKEEASEKK